MRITVGCCTPGVDVPAMIGGDPGLGPTGPVAGIWARQTSAMIEKLAHENSTKLGCRRFAPGLVRHLPIIPVIIRQTTPTKKHNGLRMSRGHEATFEQTHRGVGQRAWLAIALMPYVPRARIGMASLVEAVDRQTRRGAMVASRGFASLGPAP
jgi:hypothetical protein